MTLYLLGEYGVAKDGLFKVLDIRKRHYGEDHIEYATTQQNLCMILEKLGEYDKAKEGYLKVLEINKKSFGEDHIFY
jgi:tetratricopeptide (TPR) repeat protein